MCVLLVFLVCVCLLDQSRSSPLPWEQGSLQPFFQQQVYQTTVSTQQVSPPPAVGRQRTSSSSSSSSSSSESSQSSEGVQQLRERHRMENMAVEQMDSSQENWESPTNGSSLWISELVKLGQRAGEREGERDNEDDSVGSEETRQRTLLLTFHPLLTRLAGRSSFTDALGGVTGDGGEATGEGGGVTGEAGGPEGDVGGVREGTVDEEFDGSRERAGLTFDFPDRRHHGNEAELELQL